MPTLSTESTHDQVSYTLDLGEEIARFKVDSIDRIDTHRLLIEQFNKTILNEDNISRVEVVIPNRGKKIIQKQVGERYDEELGENVPVYGDVSVWNNGYTTCDLYDITDLGTCVDARNLNYGGRTLLVAKEDFLSFYTSNLDKLLSKVPRKFAEADDEVDEEGFTLVKNQRKLRKQSRQSVNRAIHITTKKSKKHCESILQQLREEDDDTQQDNTDDLPTLEEELVVS